MDFYRIDENTKYKDAWYNDDVMHYSKRTCPADPKHDRAYRNDHPLSIVLKGKRFGDFVSTVYADILINDRVAEIFEEHKFTGYELRDVEIVNNKFDLHLRELIITGKGGEPHPDCGMFLKYKCNHCNRTIYTGFSNETGLIVDESNWDGSDFFTVYPLPLFYLVTENVKKVIESHNLKGIKLIKSTDLRTMLGKSRIFKFQGHFKMFLTKHCLCGMLWMYRIICFCIHY